MLIHFNIPYTYRMGCLFVSPRTFFLSFSVCWSERKMCVCVRFFYEWCDKTRSLHIDKLSTCDFKYSIHLTIALNTIHVCVCVCACECVHDFELWKRSTRTQSDRCPYGVSACERGHRWNRTIRLKLVFDWHILCSNLFSLFAARNHGNMGIQAHIKFGQNIELQTTVQLKQFFFLGAYESRRASSWRGDIFSDFVKID